MSGNDQLRQAAGDYLAIRRRLGFKLQGHDRLLASFLDYLQRSESSTITVQSAVAWATAPAGVSAGYWRDRLCAVRGFARHVQGIDSSTEVPPLELIPGRRQRRTPYLYSQSDMAALMEAAACLRPALRGATYQALFGLLICTGMRVGETIALDRGDVDLRAGMLEIKEAKFRKHRRLPLHGSAVAALGRYAELRDRFCARPKDPSFFVSTRGTRLLYVCVNQVFRKLVEEIGLTAQPRAGRPRIHDLRHGSAPYQLNRRRRRCRYRFVAGARKQPDDVGDLPARRHVAQGAGPGAYHTTEHQTWPLPSSRRAARLPRGPVIMPSRSGLPRP